MGHQSYGAWDGRLRLDRWSRVSRPSQKEGIRLKRNATGKKFDMSGGLDMKLFQRWHQRGMIKTEKYGDWKEDLAGFPLDF